MRAGVISCKIRNQTNVLNVHTTRPLFTNALLHVDDFARYWREVEESSQQFSALYRETGKLEIVH